jgi:hypothetical protein
MKIQAKQIFWHTKPEQYGFDFTKWKFCAKSKAGVLADILLAFEERKC